MKLNTEQMLVEAENLLRTFPDRPADLLSDAGMAWEGRALAVMGRLGYHQFGSNTRLMRQRPGPIAEDGRRSALVMLHQAIYDLRLQLEATGTTASTVEKGAVFDYFDATRKLVEKAHQELFFVDPYLDADFVGRYMPQVKHGASVRLLTVNSSKAVKAAVDVAIKQFGLRIEARHAQGFHDRYLFIDGSECHMSGASFSHGGLKAPTILTPVYDHGPVRTQYETIWAGSTPA